MKPMAGLRLFVRQDFEERFTGNVVGTAWALVLPLLQLGLFGLLFVHVFNARAPQDLGAISYLAFLALAMWPWFAFSEAVGRAATALVDHAGLLGKVAIPYWQLVLARVVVAFAMHGVGFVLVVLVLAFNGDAIAWSHLPWLLLPWTLLFVVACCMALGLATLNVFVRDVAQIVPYLMTAMMFSAPIFFALSALPEFVSRWLQLNPVTWPIGTIRQIALGAPWPAGFVVGLTSATAVSLLGIATYLRLRRHVEDFL
ncbi:MAG: ABC transporter permease [Xanthomonadales bacterium]|nr:ABC transporter permease [Xanthomonadales bacterium]